MKLALPMTAAQLVNVLYSVVDRVYLGRLPDSDSLALTGLGITMPIVSILMGLANLCGTGGAPLCSMSRGRGEDGEAERGMGNAFTAAPSRTVIIPVRPKPWALMKGFIPRLIMTNRVPSTPWACPASL